MFDCKVIMVSSDDTGIDYDRHITKQRVISAVRKLLEKFDTDESLSNMAALTIEYDGEYGKVWVKGFVS